MTHRLPIVMAALLCPCVTPVMGQPPSFGPSSTAAAPAAATQQQRMANEIAVAVAEAINRHAQPPRR